MGPYTRAFLITSWYFAWTVCIICSCYCQCGPSWDCWRGGSSSHIFYSLPLACIASDHRGFFNYRFYSKHLGLFKKMWGLHSVLEGSPFDFWCPTFSGGGSEVAVEFCFNVHSMRSAEVFSSAWSTDHIGDICFCIQVYIFPHSRMAVFFILCSSQKLSCFLGAPIFPQVLFRTYKRCLWKSYPWFIFSLFSEKEGLLGIFHALQQA